MKGRVTLSLILGLVLVVALVNPSLAGGDNDVAGPACRDIDDVDAGYFGDDQIEVYVYLGNGTGSPRVAPCGSVVYSVALTDGDGNSIGSDSTGEQETDQNGDVRLRFDLGGPYLSQTCVAASTSSKGGQQFDIAPGPGEPTNCFLTGLDGPQTKYG